jgi:hypothetical protein
LAPEILLCIASKEKDLQYSSSTDVYAFGILINEVFSHTPPFPGLTFRNIIAKIQKADNNRPSLFAANYNAISSGSTHGNSLILELKSLIERSWSSNSEQRPSISHVSLILKRLLLVSDSFPVSSSSSHDSHSMSMSSMDATSGKSTDDISFGGNATITSSIPSFSARKSFYQRGATLSSSMDANDNTTPMKGVNGVGGEGYEMGNDLSTDLSMSRDAGDSTFSPTKGSTNSKIATIIEGYEKGSLFGTPASHATGGEGFLSPTLDPAISGRSNVNRISQTYEKGSTPSKSGDFQDSYHPSSSSGMYDKFERSMDRSMDKSDLPAISTMRNENNVGSNSTDALPGSLTESLSEEEKEDNDPQVWLFLLHSLWFFLSSSLRLLFFSYRVESQLMFPL